MAKLENLAADPLEAVIGFEQALIGTVLFDQKMYYEAMDLTPQDFGTQKHQVIWAAVATCRAARRPDQDVADRDPDRQGRAGPDRRHQRPGGRHPQDRKQG